MATSSFQDKVLVTSDIIKKFYSFNCVIFVVCSGVISSFEDRNDIKQYANGKGAAVVFVDSPIEAVQVRDSMLANLAEIKNIAADENTVLVIDGCVAKLAYAVIMQEDRR